MTYSQTNMENEKLDIISLYVKKTKILEMICIFLNILSFIRRNFCTGFSKLNFFVVYLFEINVM